MMNDVLFVYGDDDDDDDGDGVEHFHFHHLLPRLLDHRNDFDVVEVLLHLLHVHLHLKEKQNKQNKIKNFIFFCYQ